MRTLKVRNVHLALPAGIDLLLKEGITRDSRNGCVLIAPCPITTEYLKPTERLTFWPLRDVNTAFLVYEALWMLAGRNDLAPLRRYIKDFGRFSDDGETLHGAYGRRWRTLGINAVDQLAVIARRLRADPDDRRCILQIWDGRKDLDAKSKDVPCNDMVAFQRDHHGALDMTVFCRSNDIIWGAYFANAFHFSVLHEYMAGWIGCPVGVYRQISVNYHAYEATLDEGLRNIPRAAFDALYSYTPDPDNPYKTGRVIAFPLWDGVEDVRAFDRNVADLLHEADGGFTLGVRDTGYAPWFTLARTVLRAHHVYATWEGPHRFEAALAALQSSNQSSDLIVSMKNWITRRYESWLQKQQHTMGTAHE